MKRLYRETHSKFCKCPWAEKRLHFQNFTCQFSGVLTLTHHLGQATMINFEVVVRPMFHAVYADPLHFALPFVFPVRGKFVHRGLQFRVACGPCPIKRRPNQFRWQISQHFQLPQNTLGCGISLRFQMHLLGKLFFQGLKDVLHSVFPRYPRSDFGTVYA